MHTIHLSLKLTFTRTFKTKFAIIPILRSENIDVLNQIISSEEFLSNIIIDLNPNNLLNFNMTLVNAGIFHELLDGTTDWLIQGIRSGKPIPFSKKHWFELTNEEVIDGDIYITKGGLLISEDPLDSPI